jgi:acetoin utilization deacetylase AcuC-like enzyme
MPVALVSNSDCGRHDTGWGHPEHVGRLRAIPSALRNDPDLFQTLLHIEGRHATAADLALVHDAEYVASVERAVAAADAATSLIHLDPDTVVSGGSWVAATAAAGCVMDAVDMAADGRAIRSFCAIRPPGHHAVRDRAMGFCLFGNVALAARWARQHHAMDRVLIVDWDVHHGNGTQALVEADEGIHYVSMHQWPWYPGTGPASDRGPNGTVWNVPLPGGLDRTQYTGALLAAVDRAAAGFAPDLVLVSAGFDSLRGDPLGGFTLELEDIDLLTRELRQRAELWCQGRVVSALEGGYAVERTAAACVAHLRAMV